MKINIRKVETENLIGIPNSRISPIADLLYDAGYSIQVIKSDSDEFGIYPKEKVRTYTYLENDNIEDLQDDALVYGYDYLVTNADKDDVWELIRLIYEFNMLDDKNHLKMNVELVPYV